MRRAQILIRLVPHEYLEIEMNVGLRRVGLLANLMDHIFQISNSKAFYSRQNERQVYYEEELPTVGNVRSVCNLENLIRSKSRIFQNIRLFLLLYH